MAQNEIEGASNIDELDQQKGGAARNLDQDGRAKTSLAKSSLSRRVQDAAEDLYNKAFGKKQISAGKDGRHIPLAVERREPLVDDRWGHPYTSNDIHTSRYTLWDFVPKQIFFQFTRVGNFYFLCVGVPQMVCVFSGLTFIDQRV